MKIAKQHNSHLTHTESPVAWELWQHDARKMNLKLITQVMSMFGKAVITNT